MKPEHRVTPHWDNLRETIRMMETFPKGAGWHINADAMKCALDHVDFLEAIGANPPKIFIHEDEAVVFTWREQGPIVLMLTADEDGKGSIHTVDVRARQAAKEIKP